MTNYTCERARQQMLRVVDGLKQARVINRPPSVEQIHRMTRGCEPCTTGAKPGECLGWRIVVPPEEPIVLGPFADKGTAVKLRLSCDVSYARSAAQGPDDWRLYPVSEANVGVEVWDKHESVALTRHHVDLGNPRQHGPVWHLQAGGRGFGDIRLDMPRWVTMPLDLVLTIDLMVYNYNHGAWRGLQKNGTYRGAVLVSEELLQSAWIQKVREWTAKPAIDRSVTLLRALDNETLQGWEPLWNPRPT